MHPILVPVLTIATATTETKTVEYSPNNTIAFTMVKRIESSYSFYNIDSRKESFYIKAIKNLRKKINFLQLNFEFQNGDVEEAEYEKEIEENPDKYIVDVSLLRSQFDYELLNDIVSKLGENLSISEVAEIFSLDVNYTTAK